MEDIDRALALAMQAEYDLESSFTYEDDNKTKLNTSSDANISPRKSFANQPKSLVDPAWELIDPNPDIFALFWEFNAKYFWSKLSMVEVKWSPRMTLCAGLCCYQGRGGLCSIRLSKPLLQLRPRKDLIETLLHEMIHALLFVTDNNKDHDGHGPEFCKHMSRLNKETGTNITIYHNFNDEVDSLRKHWWRCEGPCRKKAPYFGFVRRAMNRAPSPRDTWWAKHQSTCGGDYIKVKEPENYKAKKNKKRSTVAKHTDPDITPFLSQPCSSNTKSCPCSSGNINATSLPTPGQGVGQKLGGTPARPQTARGIPSFSRLLTSQPNMKDHWKKATPESSTPKFATNLDNWLTGATTVSTANKLAVPAEGDLVDQKHPKPPKIRKLPSSDVNNHTSIGGMQKEEKKTKRNRKKDSKVDITAKKHTETIIIDDTSPSAVETTPCPICHKTVAIAAINHHVDECLSVKAIMDSSFE